jgi:hypothetical protein
VQRTCRDFANKRTKHAPFPDEVLSSAAGTSAGKGRIVVEQAVANIAAALANAYGE